VRYRTVCSKSSFPDPSSRFIRRKSARFQQILNHSPYVYPPRHIPSQPLTFSEDLDTARIRHISISTHHFQRSVQPSRRSCTFYYIHQFPPHDERTLQVSRFELHPNPASPRAQIAPATRSIKSQESRVKMARTCTQAYKQVAQCGCVKHTRIKDGRDSLGESFLWLTH
jgi:hypothetical protein